jgi:predicted transcriptional regulator
LFALLGLLANPFLLLIALFIWIGATQEATMAQVKSALEGVSARKIMVTDFISLTPEDTLKRAVDLVLHGTQQDFPVVENGRLVGMLGNKELLEGLSQRGDESSIAESIRREFPVLAVGDQLPAVLEKLQNSNRRVLPAVDHGELVGLFTAENLAEFVMVQSALRRHSAPSNNVGKSPCVTSVTSGTPRRQAQ